MVYDVFLHPLDSCDTLLTFYGIQSKQLQIGENLQLADALGLELDRPGQSCNPLPPGYTSEIMGEYPNQMRFSLISGGSLGGGSAPSTGSRRGKPSVLAHQHHVRLRKQRQKIQKAKAFEIRSRKA